jgi:3-deoxy-D-manno-octulosonic-acid transferase
MNTALRLGYAAAAQLARGAAVLAPRGQSKLLRALAARRGIRARYGAWGRTGRDPARPLLWMHAPSVGEGLQARPVLELMRRSRGDVQLAYTHFSPSALNFARTLDVDFHDYLPFDTAGDARAALDALRPTALVFSKLDVWPVLVGRAAARGVRIGMVSATLSSGSSRRSGIATALLRDAYSRLDAVGAIDAADADRLIALGVRPAAVHVTGDTRYDQVWRRAEQVDRSGALLASLDSPRPTLVAGSTWPADEAVLLEAWLDVRRAVPGARLVIAPHEPTAAHLAPVEAWAAREGLRLVRLGEDGAEADVVLVDRTGVLGDLYAIGTVAYVGGGFHAAGLHSVLEPAAFGLPVLFGPRHANSRDAGLLLASGGGIAATDARDLAEWTRRWLVDANSEGREAGTRARAMVRAGLGAAQRSFELVEGLLG